MVLRRVIRWSVVVVVGAHGLLHRLGAVKGLGRVDVAPLSAEVGPWLTAISLLLLAVAGHTWARTGPRSLRADDQRPVRSGAFAYLEFVVDELSPIEGVPWAWTHAPPARSVASPGTG